jgi:hypothetical protein
MDAGRLICPGCSREARAQERFCDRCGMPLVLAGEQRAEPSPRQQLARKIKPQYAEGRLVQVARASDLAQAEFIAGLLLEEGIPSMLRGAIAGYAPLIGGREVMVPESGAQAAREVLAFRQF